MALRVLLVDEDPTRASQLEEILSRLGYELLGRIQAGASLTDQVRQLAPDVLIVDLGSPDRDTIEQMRTISRHQPKPIVMFAEESDEGLIAEAVKAGVSAYVVDGVAPQRVKPILDVAIAQFREFQSLKDELAQAKTTLAERKLIERAKGLLMQQRGCSEAEAYEDMRKLAMNRGVRLSDIAENIIAITDLLKK